MPLAELGGMDQAELEELVVRLGQPRYRATQIRQQAWKGVAGEFAEIATLPQAVRHQLAQRVGFQSLVVAAEQDTDRGLTTKLLLRGRSGADEIETVLIRHPGQAGRGGRNTVCVSSQVGCAIGCVFCATGQLGLRRNLSAAEIVDQVRLAGTRAQARGWGPVSHVVFMGMGEPLHNYDPVVRAIRLLQGWGISPRRMVVSTSGLVPEIDRLASEGLAVRLAISLHAGNDLLRDRLVPLNRRYPLAELKAAAQRFSAATGRRVTLEYVLIDGVNDAATDALALRQLADELHAHVNLIPMNRIPSSDLHAPGETACRHFAQLVGARASIRFSRGARANAACGQLRASLEPEPRRSARSALAALELESV